MHKNVISNYVQTFDTTKNAWSVLDVRLPHMLSQFQSIYIEEKGLFVFGGIVGDPKIKPQFMPSDGAFLAMAGPQQ